MKKRILALFLIICLILPAAGCSKSSYGSTLIVTFIDVGQGDAALVECGGEYMLIDTGPNNKTSINKIKRLLMEKNILTLKYLVISHMHDDHYGGLINDALQNVKIETTLCNEDPHKNSNVISHLDGSQLIIPTPGEKGYMLGSAAIEIIDVRADQRNDSLVLLITHGETSFLFTGDIEKEAQSSAAAKLREMSDKLDSGENLIKMPHHGAYNSDRFLPESAYDNSLGTLISAAYAKYFVISVGKNNSYDHPHWETLDLINRVLQTHNFDQSTHLFRTDDDRGDIVATSDGKRITISRQGIS